MRGGGSMRPVWRSRTYQKFLFSFCLILVLLAIAFSSLMRGMVFNSAKNDLESSSTASVNQSAFYVNQLLTNMDAISATMGSTVLINNYHIATMATERTKLIRSLRQYQSFNSMISDIFYIPVRGPYLMSENSTYTLDTFSRLYKRSFLTLDRLEELLSKSNTQQFAFLDDVADTVLGNGTKKQVVSVFYSLPPSSVGKYALLLFDISADKLADMLAIYMPSGHAYLTDDTGAPLCASEQLAMSKEQLDGVFAQMDGEEFGEVSLDGGGYYAAAATLQHGWHLLYLIPRTLLTREVGLRQAQFVLYFIAVTGFGLLLAFLLSFWNYRPILRLSRNLPMDNTPGKLDADDLKTIEQGVRSMVSSSSTLKARLEDSRPAVMAQHLLNLINNRYTEADLARLREDGLTLRKENYVIALFAPHNADIIRKEGGWIGWLQSCMPPQWDACFVEYHPSRLYIGLLSLAPVPAMELKAQMEAVRLALPSPAAVSISRQTEELFNLAPSFIQAQIALQQRFFSGYNHVYAYEESQKSAADYPYTLLNRIGLELSAKNEGACQKALNALFSYMQSSSFSLETVYCICFEVLGELMRHLTHSSIPLYHIEGLLPDIVQVTRSETLEEIQQLMNEALEASFDALNSPEDATPSSLPEIQEIFAFINQNGFRSDFSVQVIAEHFNVSYPYLGKYFKSMTGTTLNKYVQEQRIAQARRLLVTTDLNLTEIVEQIGYIDMSSFIKLFKQVTGMTPIAYRKLYQ